MLPEPRRSAPAAPKGVDHHAVDVCLSAGRTLAQMPPPPRSAPGAWGEEPDANNFPRFGSMERHHDLQLRTCGNRLLHLAVKDHDDLESIVSKFLERHGLST